MHTYIHTCMYVCWGAMGEFIVGTYICVWSDYMTQWGRWVSIGRGGRWERWGRTLWSWQVCRMLQFRSGWRLRQSGEHWVAPAWSFVGTVGPSVAGFFRGRPSPEIWRSSAHRGLTSCQFDYRSSRERMGGNVANEETRLALSCMAEDFYNKWMLGRALK